MQNSQQKKLSYTLKFQQLQKYMQTARSQSLALVLT